MFKKDYKTPEISLKSVCDVLLASGDGYGSDAYDNVTTGEIEL